MNSRFSFILFLLMACFMMSSGMIFQAHAVGELPPPPPPLPVPAATGTTLAQQKAKLGTGQEAEATKPPAKSAKSTTPDYDVESDYKKKHSYYSYSPSASASASGLTSGKKSVKGECALGYAGEKALIFASNRVQNYCQICQLKNNAKSKECHRVLEMVKESFIHCTQEDEVILILLNDFMENQQFCELRLVEDITYDNAHASSHNTIEKLVTKENVLLLTETLEKTTKFSLELTKGILEILVLIQKYNDAQDAQN